FVVLDFIADPRVPLILGRPFLSTAHTIINVHEREIILRQDQQSLTIQCGDIPSIKKVEQINKIDFINAGGRYFDSEEIENFLNDDSIPIGVEDSPFNLDEDIIFLEGLLIEDPFPPHLMIPNQTKSPIKEPKHSFNMRLLQKMEESIEPVKDESTVFMTFSNPLFDNDKINSDEINSQVESNSDESTSNHDTVKFDYLDEFYGPFIPIHIVEEERIRREHADYINRMEMLFIINPRPHHPMNANINVEFFSSLPIPIQESDPQQEEIDVVTETDDVLPPNVENDDSDGEFDAVNDLRVDNSILNSKHEYSESEDSDFDNPSIPLPPLKPPDKEFDFKINFGVGISVVRNTVVKFEFIDARVKLDVFNDENDDLSYSMFVKVFSLLSAESEDTIFDPAKNQTISTQDQKSEEEPDQKAHGFYYFTRIAEYAAAPTPPSPLSPLSSPLPQIHSPPLPITSPPTTIPTYAEVPLGYRAAKIRLRAASPSTHHPSGIPSLPLLLPSTLHRDDTLEADIPLQKRARFNTPVFGFEVGESSATTLARQPVLDVATVDATLRRLVSREVGYGIEDVWDGIVGDIKERALTNLRLEMTELFKEPKSTYCLETDDIIFTQLYLWRARLGAPDKHGHMPWTTRDACIGSLEILVATVVAQTLSPQTQLTTALRRIQTLEAREPSRTNDLEDAGSSC
nr:hypothetical protein [Tanacetum cinerariifolium]